MSLSHLGTNPETNLLHCCQVSVLIGSSNYNKSRFFVASKNQWRTWRRYPNSQERRAEHVKLISAADRAVLRNVPPQVVLRVSCARPSRVDACVAGGVRSSAAGSSSGGRRSIKLERQIASRSAAGSAGERFRRGCREAQCSLAKDPGM